MKITQIRWRKVIHIVLSVLLILACILVTAVFIMNRNGKNMEEIRETLLSPFKGNRQTDIFYYDNGRTGVFAEIDGHFMIASATGIQLFGEDGEEIFFKSGVMDSPAVKSRGEYALAYDVGGTKVFLLDKNGLVYSMLTEEPIISGDVRSDGKFVLCTQESGYFGLATVYTVEGNAIFRWYSGENHLLAAALDDSDDQLAVLTLGQRGSKVTRFRLDQEDPVASVQFDQEVALDMAFREDDVLVVVAADHLYFTNGQGTITGQYDYSGKLLLDYTLLGGSGVAVAYRDYENSMAGTVAVLNTKAEVLGEKTVDGEIAALTMDKKTVAVLFNTQLILYNQKMEEKETFEPDPGCGSVLLRAGEYAIATGDYSAEVFTY